MAHIPELNPHWLTKRTKQFFNFIKILLRSKDITSSTAFDLFDKLITPTLCYGCQVWPGFDSAPDIDRVRLSFCKRVMCVKNSSQNTFVYGSLGRFPLELNRQCRIMSYWLKIVTGFKSMDVSQLYQASLSRLDNTAPQTGLVKSNICYVLSDLVMFGTARVWLIQ